MKIVARTSGTVALISGFIRVDEGTRDDARGEISWNEGFSLSFSLPGLGF